MQMIFRHNIDLYFWSIFSLNNDVANNIQTLAEQYFGYDVQELIQIDLRH